MQIAEFFASLKIKPDRASIARADRWLKTFEKRIQRSARRVEKSNVLGTMLGLNEKKVARQAQRTLDVVSKSAVFRINNFKINTKRLQQTLDAVIRNNNTPLAINNFRINRNSLRKSLEMAAASFAIPVRVSGATGGRRSSQLNPNPLVNNNNRQPRRSGSRFSLSPRGVGFAAGGIGVFGGFGIAALNRTVRELESLPVALEAVTGSPERAAAELSYLNDLGNEVGAPVRTLAPEYTKFLASAIGTPLEDSSKSSYRSILRYAKVIGMDDQAVKGTLKAITQIANKQRVYAEELVGQLGERAPAAIRMMADAIADGDTKKLFEMMERGDIDPNTALPALAAQMGMVADRGWNARLQTMGHQQDITSKRFEDFIKLFSASGGSNGFFNIWKSFADTLPRLENIARALGSSFESFGSGVARTGDILAMFSDTLGWLNKQSPEFQDAIIGISGAFALLATNIGRTMLPLVAIFLMLEDIASYREGRKSLTGLALGEDYGPKAPESIRVNNPYKGMLAGRHIHNLEKSGGFFSGAAADFMKGPVFQYHPILRSNLWAAEALFIPNYDTIKLTSEASMAAMSTSISGIDKIPGFSPSGLTIENITINANTNDPEEHANQFIKRIELDMSAVNFPKGEGEG